MSHIRITYRPNPSSCSTFSTPLGRPLGSPTFRRAGREFTRGEPYEFPLADFTAEQLAQLESDPQLTTERFTP